MASKERKVETNLAKKEARAEIERIQSDLIDLQMRMYGDIEHSPEPTRPIARAINDLGDVWDELDPQCDNWD
jgi:hypothetical protein